MNKRFPRFAVILMTVLIVCLLCLGLSACIKKPRKQHVFTSEQKTILYLGDSIAEAVAGPSPLTERETYGYYGILGNINGYKFYNRAVSGDKTSDLLNVIQREDDGISMIHSLIATSDIIHISITGNDLLGHDINNMLVQVAEKKFDKPQEYADIAYNNLDKIISWLRAVNPDAVIILQTTYNPVGKDSPLVSGYAKMRLASMAYTPNDYHKLAGEMIDVMNETLRKYLRENEKKFEYEPYYLVDVAAAFEDIYKTAPNRWARLFCPDGIHPANEGHAIIAETNQKLLEELGIADPKALENYKKLRCDQLSRLYSNSVEVSSVKKVIGDCETFSDVSLAYFNATYGKDANYRVADAEPVGVHFAEDKEFGISTFTLRGLDLTKVYVPQLKSYLGVMSQSDSYIRFNADGPFEMRYVINDGLIGTLKQLEEWGLYDLPLNVSEIIDLDINYLQSTYLQHMFPGFDYANLNDSLQLISETIGVEITGPDFTTQAMREMAIELGQTGNFILRNFDVLGDSLGITWRGSYRIVEQEDMDGNKLTAIYIGENFYTGESYLRFTYRDTEDGEKVRLTVDVADVVLEGDYR